MYELLASLLEEDGVDRLDTEDPARLRTSAAAKLAEITEVCCADARTFCACKTFPGRGMLCRVLQAYLSCTPAGT